MAVQKPVASVTLQIQEAQNIRADILRTPAILAFLDAGYLSKTFPVVRQVIVKKLIKGKIAP